MERKIPMEQGLFIYGTLQLRSVLNRLLGRIPPLIKANLKGYRVACLRGYSFPGLIEDEANEASGQHLQGLTHRELEILDEYEGEMYERKRVKVLGDEVWTYAIKPKYRDLILAEVWNLEKFTKDSENMRQLELEMEADL